MKKNPARYALAALILLALPLTASGQESNMAAPGPAAHVANTASQAFDILRRDALSRKEKLDLLRPVLNANFDLRYIRAAALGDLRKSATPDQLTRYIDLFPEYILSRYAQLLEQYAKETLSTKEPQPIQENIYTVSSRVTQPRGAPVRIDWIVRTKDGAPLILEIRVEGISETKTVRGEFTTIVRAEGFDGLLTRMAALIADLGEG